MREVFPHSCLNTLTLCLLSVLVWNSTQASAQEYPSLLFIDRSSTPPFSYPIEEDKDGVFLEVLREITQPLGFSLNVSRGSGSRAVSQLLSGRRDLMMVMTYADITLEQYPKDLLVCPVEIAEFPIRFYSFNPDHAQLSNSQISTKKIGMMRVANETHSVFLKHNLQFVERYRTGGQVFKALAAGRVDLAISDPYSIRKFALTNNLPETVELPLDLGVVKVYVALSKQSELRLDIYDRLCLAVSKAKENNFFQKALARHLPNK